jgi:predicted DNA-binding transcriptional regulator AlpA
MMRHELQPAMELASHLSVDELPQLLGDLEQIRVVALARLISPIVATNDELLDVEQAAARLHVTRDWIYRHHRQFPFTKRLGESEHLLRFSSKGIDAYLKSR